MFNILMFFFLSINCVHAGDSLTLTNVDQEITQELKTSNKNIKVIIEKRNHLCTSDFQTCIQDEGFLDLILSLWGSAYKKDQDLLFAPYFDLSNEKAFVLSLDNFNTKANSSLKNRFEIQMLVTNFLLEKRWSEAIKKINDKSSNDFFGYSKMPNRRLDTLGLYIKLLWQARPVSFNLFDKVLSEYLQKNESDKKKMISAKGGAFYLGQVLIVLFREGQRKKILDLINLHETDFTDQGVSDQIVLNRLKCASLRSLAKSEECILLVEKKQELNNGRFNLEKAHSLLDGGQVEGALKAYRDYLLTEKDEMNLADTFIYKSWAELYLKNIQLAEKSFKYFQKRFQEPTDDVTKYGADVFEIALLTEKKECVSLKRKTDAVSNFLNKFVSGKNAFTSYFAFQALQYAMVCRDKNKIKEFSDLIKSNISQDNFDLFYAKAATIASDKLKGGTIAGESLQVMERLKGKNNPEFIRFKGIVNLY